MPTKDWRQTAELVGIAAIVASLIFVGIEMRQTRELAMANAYQARSELEISLSLAYVAPETLTRAIAKIRDGQVLSNEEHIQHSGLMRASFTYWENSHYQWQNGLLDDDYWEAEMASMRVVLSNPIFRQYWEQQRLVMRGPFREVGDKMIAESETEEIE